MASQVRCEISISVPANRRQIRRPSRQHLVDNGRERVDVRSQIDVRAVLSVASPATHVVSPAVAADDPHGLADKVVGQRLQPARSGPSTLRNSARRARHARPLPRDAGLRSSVGLKEGAGKGRPDPKAEAVQQ